MEEIMQEELDLFNVQQHEDQPVKPKELSKEEQFLVWKASDGSKQVLRNAYRYAYPYANRFLRTGQRVSMRLIWEMLRDHIKNIRRRCKLKGVQIKQWKGYTLNDHLHAHVARHIISHKPEWTGMFEMRQTAEEKAADIVVS